MPHSRRVLTPLLGAIALTLALTVPAAAGAKTFDWGARTAIASGKGNTFLGTIACPSATVCTSAGELLGANYNGYVADFDPLALGTVTPRQMAVASGAFSEPRFSDVSCPSATQCTAVNGAAWTYDPASPSSATSTAGYARFVSCPTTTECVAIQQGDYGPSNPDPYPNGTVVVSAFNPQAPPAHTDTVITAGTASNGPSNVTFGLKCPTTTECVLVASNNTDAVEWTFDPLVSSTPSPAVVDPGVTDTGSARLSCPTAAECVLVDRGGHEVTFNPAAPGAPNPVDIDSDPGYMAGVACPSGTQCTAIDANARAITFDPTAPATQSVTGVADSDDLASIDCPSTAECVTIGGSGTGNLYVGRLINGTPTGTTAVAKPAVKGTAAAVSISCKGVKGLACPVKLSLTTKIKRRIETVGTTSRTIDAGHKATVTVHLDRAGTKLLAADKKLAVKLTVAESGAKPVTKTVTFKQRK